MVYLNEMKFVMIEIQETEIDVHTLVIWKITVDEKYEKKIFMNEMLEKISQKMI
jgi:hypothetical protein